MTTKPIQENPMTNPADEAICMLIEDLTRRATRLTTNAEERQNYINQIAQLRASMNPQIIQQVR
jgi:hypothetical protein